MPRVMVARSAIRMSFDGRAVTSRGVNSSPEATTITRRTIRKPIRVKPLSS